MKELSLEQIREHKKELYDQQEKDYARIERLTTFMSNGYVEEVHKLNAQIGERYFVLNELVLQEAKLESVLFESRFEGLVLQEARLEGEK